MMRAGKLDRRIALAAKGAGTDAYGQPSGSYATYATVWASYAPISDGERFRAGQIEANTTARFQIRYSRDVAGASPSDRLIFNGRTYEIAGVKEIGRNEGFEITAGAEVSRDAS